MHLFCLLEIDFKIGFEPFAHCPYGKCFPYLTRSAHKQDPPVRVIDPGFKVFFN
jgi:hypothetical protein